MKYFTSEEEFKNAQKEKTLDLKSALLNRIEWRLKNFERKNLNKEKRQAYEYLKNRLEQAYSWEFEKFHEDTECIQLINWLLNNNLTLKDMAAHVFFKIDGENLCCDYAIKKMAEPVKNNTEVKHLYNNALFLLSSIYSDYACDQIYLKKMGN